jgi:hypothetical protein
MTNVHLLPPELVCTRTKTMKKNAQHKERNIINASGISVSGIMPNQLQCPFLLLMLSYVYLWEVGLWGCTCHVARLEMRWQLAGVDSLTPPWVPKAVRLGSQHLYPPTVFSSRWLVCDMEPCSAIQVGLKVYILLPRPPKCWDCRHVLPHLDTQVLSTVSMGIDAFRHSVEFMCEWKTMSFGWESKGVEKK